MERFWRCRPPPFNKIKMKVSCFMLLLMMFFAMMLQDHQPSIGSKAMALVLDRSPEMGKVKIASTNHFSTEVKVGQRGRRSRRAIPSPPPPKPNRLGRWKWVVPPVFGAPPTPTPPMPSSPPPPSPLSSSKGAWILE
jgi:hypothetical protein